MGQREVRPVAYDWEHPRDGIYRDGSPRYAGLHSRAKLRLDRADYAENPGDWDAPPDPADYMPELREGTPYGYQLYEITTEGSPVSPIFGTLEELAAWCETGADVWAGVRLTKEEWLGSFGTAGGTQREEGRTGWVMEWK